MKLKRS